MRLFSKHLLFSDVEMFIVGWYCNFLNGQMFSALHNITTYQALEQAGAQLLYGHVFNQEIGFANWINKDSYIDYHCNKAHTLSLYLEGGYRTTRTDCSVGYGHKDAICLLPEDSDSSWFVSGDINLFHFYFSDKAIRRFVAKTYDIEPLTFNVPELTFCDDLNLKSSIHQLINTVNHESHLKKETAINKLFDALLSLTLKRKRNYKGGLSPAINRQLKDYMYSHFSQTITLESLSSLAELSEFHLQRMFKQSNGISPHDYLMELRIEKVKSLLTKMPLSQISQECGFSHQSHMHRVFKQRVGITPLQYLNEL